MSLGTQNTEVYRGKCEIVCDLNTGEVIRGNKMTSAVPLASVTKLMTAATAFYLKGKYSHYQMGRFLSRSDNSMGPIIARQTSGSEAKFVAEMNAHAHRIGMKHSNFMNTTGLNPDGTGPTASAADIVRLLRWFHTQPGGDEFLKKYASPKSGFGHTMGYAFAQGGVIGAKTGTNPQAGDVTGAVLFKGDKGHTYAAFMHGKDTEARKELIPELIQEARNGKPKKAVAYLDTSRPTPGKAAPAKYAGVQPKTSSPWRLNLQTGA